MIDGLLRDIERCRPIHEDRAALVDLAQAKIDTELYHVNAFTRSPSAMNEEAKENYGMIGGSDKLNRQIESEAGEEEQALVVMLRGWHEFQRDRPGIMPPSLADWLIEIGYARWPTDAEVEEINREDVPVPDPADKGKALRIAARVHTCKSHPSQSVSGSVKTPTLGGLEPRYPSRSSMRKR
jgi:hypothetical protein